jgi:PilZ domain
VLDLSLKGALVRLPGAARLAAGDPCLLSVSLSEMEVAIAMAGEIAHVEGDRVGLLCRSIDIESITHLRRLLEINLGDAQLLERELKALVSS